MLLIISGENEGFISVSATNCSIDLQCIKILQHHRTNEFSYGQDNESDDCCLQGLCDTSRTRNSMGTGSGCCKTKIEALFEIKQVKKNMCISFS